MTSIASMSLFEITPLCMLGGALICLWYGWRGRYIGDEPHCKKCNHNLSEPTVERCPECGSTLGKGAVVIGMRQRRPVLLLVAAALVFVSGSTLGLLAYVRLGQVSLYKHYPMGVLMDLTRDDDLEAVYELVRRVESGLIGASQLRPMAELALWKHKQTQEEEVFRQTAWANLLGVMLRDGVLTDEQKRRFLDQTWLTTLDVRRRIRQGDPVVFVVRLSYRGGIAFPMPMRLGPTQTVRFAGDSYSVVPSEWRRVGPWDETSPMYLIEWVLEPGTHPFEYVCLLNWYSSVAARGAEPVWSTERVLTGEVEVLPERGSDPITLTRDRTVADLLRGAFKVWAETDGRWEGQASGPYRAYLHLPAVGAVPRPVCLAAEVFTQLGDNVTRIGELHLPRGTSPQNDVLEFFVPGPEIRELTVVLRSDRTTVSRSLDCYESWEGELCFGSIEIEPYGERLRRLLAAQKSEE